MENREIAKLLSETAKLMELHNANEFKIRSYQNASFLIGKTEQPLKSLSLQELAQVKGVGKSLSQKIYDLIQTGVLEEYENLVNDTPLGVLEIMHIKGIGPKKVALLWKELGLESTGELLYACNENRLVELKGFGAKTQQQIKLAIEYSISNQGLFHYAALEPKANKLVSILSGLTVVKRVSLTGDIRRKSEVLSQIEILVGAYDKQKLISELKSAPFLENATLNEQNNLIEHVNEKGIKVKLYLAEMQEFSLLLLNTTGNAEHLQQLKLLPGFESINNSAFDEESEIYKALGLQYIEPELREGFEEIQLAKTHSIPDLIQFSDLKGSLHNHSTYSDGIHSLKEMAVACKQLDYEYLGICDHSKSAFYANGLSEERIHQQHNEIDELNKELAPFIIFKGIESDILSDGSLDYNEEILRKFDFIVASIHSGLKMNEEKATERLLKAISNPFTTILGHPTGRLLLARKGYPIDHKKVIDACAEHNVIIELNAHPYRLDLDWRWIQYALQQNVRISINPDAHHKERYQDMYYGVCVARKGMLTRSMTFNALGSMELKEWFQQRKG